MSFTGKCPMCGFEERSLARPVTHAMNTYKSSKGTAVFNNQEETFTGKDGVLWTKQAPDKSQEIIGLRPTTSAAIKAVTEVTAPPVTFTEEAGNPVTGVAKGAKLVGHETSPSVDSFVK